MPVNEYTRIGWIGLGQMGNPMVTRLLDGNIEVGIYNRSPGKTDSLAAKGAKVYGSTIELVRDYPVIFLMVSDYAAVRDILAGEMLTKLQGKIIVNMSTISPTENLAVKELVESAGGQFAEAPVSGSVGPATNGTLLILFGGDETVLNPLQKVFSLVGKKTFHFGEVGQGSGAKLVLNSLLGIFSSASIPTPLLRPSAARQWTRLCFKQKNHYGQTVSSPLPLHSNTLPKTLTLLSKNWNSRTIPCPPSKQPLPATAKHSKRVTVIRTFPAFT